MNLLKTIFDPINKFLDGKKRVLFSIGTTATALGAMAVALTDGLEQGDLIVLGGGISAILGAWGFTHASQKVEALIAKKLS